MIRVYYLPVEIIDGDEQVAGIEFIHDAILDTTEDPGVRKLIQDTTDNEHDGLVTLAVSWSPATQDEIDRYNTDVTIIPPNPDAIRAAELLTTSAAVITQPEIWELIRIFGRLHHIPD